MRGTVRQGDTRENAFRTFGPLIFWRIKKEVRSDGVNTIDTADYLVIRSRAGVALQQKLGICAQRRHRFSSGNRAYSAAAARILGRHDQVIEANTSRRIIRCHKQETLLKRQGSIPATVVAVVKSR